MEEKFSVYCDSVLPISFSLDSDALLPLFGLGFGFEIYKLISDACAMKSLNGPGGL